MFPLRREKLSELIYKLPVKRLGQRQCEGFPVDQFLFFFNNQNQINMEQKKNMLKGIHHLSEQDRLELFNVEELETRLEMAAVAGETNSNCNGTCNQGCVPVDANGACW